MKTKKNRRTIWVRGKGNFWAFNTRCHTLKEVMATYPLYAKRSWIAEWWYDGDN